HLPAQDTQSSPTRRSPDLHLAHIDTPQASVQSPGAFAANLSERGNKLREEGANIVGDSSKIIGAASTSLAQQGEEVQKKVKGQQDRKSTRLNSSHARISSA